MLSFQIHALADFLSNRWLFTGAIYGEPTFLTNQHCSSSFYQDILAKGDFFIRHVLLS